MTQTPATRGLGVQAALFVSLWAAAAFAARSFGIWFSIGGLALVLGVVVFVLDPKTTRALLRPAPRHAIIGLVAGVAMAAATHLLYPLAASAAPFLAVETGHLYAAFRGPPTWVVSVVLAPIIVGEELVWRGVVQSALLQRLKPPLAVAVCAGVYALAHAPVGSVALTLTALACGLVWGTLRAVTGSMLPSLLSHLLWDAVVLLWFPLH